MAPTAPCSFCRRPPAASLRPERNPESVHLGIHHLLSLDGYDSDTARFFTIDVGDLEALGDGADLLLGFRGNSGQVNSVLTPSPLLRSSLPSMRFWGTGSPGANVANTVRGRYNSFGRGKEEHPIRRGTWKMFDCRTTCIRESGIADERRIVSNRFSVLASLLAVCFLFLSFAVSAVDTPPEEKSGGRRALDNAVFNLIHHPHIGRNEGYSHIKQYFIKQGEKALPFLNGKLHSSAVTQRLLAKIIIDEIKNPGYLDKLERRLLHSIYPKVVFPNPDMADDDSFNFHEYQQALWQEERKYFSSRLEGDLDEEYFNATLVPPAPPELLAEIIWGGDVAFFPPSLVFAKHPNKETLLLLFGSGESVNRPLVRVGVLAMGKDLDPLRIQFLEKLTNDADNDFKKLAAKRKEKGYHSQITFKFKMEWKGCEVTTPLWLAGLLSRHIFGDKRSPARELIKKLAKTYCLFQLELSPPQSDGAFDFFDAASRAKAEEALPALTTLYFESLAEAQFIVKCNRTCKWRRKRLQDSRFVKYEAFLKRYGEIGAAYLDSKEFAEPAYVDKNRVHCSKYARDALRHALAGDIRDAKDEKWKFAKARKRALLHGTPSELWRLYQTTGEDIVPRLLHLLRIGYLPRLESRSYEINNYLPVLDFLEKLKDERTVKPLLTLIRKDYQEIAEALEKEYPDTESKTATPNPKKKSPFDGVDFQLAREKGAAFGSMFENIYRQLIEGDAVIRVLRSLRDIRSDAAKKALMEIKEFPPFEKRARIALTYSEGKIGELRDFAESDDRACRDEAALLLTEKGYGDYADAIFEAAARRNSYDIEQWKRFVVALSPNLAGFLRKHSKNGDYRERVLARTMLLELENPEFVQHYRAVFLKKANETNSYQVLSCDKVFDAGRALTKAENGGEALDESSIPLLEHTALFERGIVRRGIAVAALSVFKKPSSLPVLKDALEMGSLCGNNPAVRALREFGLPAREMAALIPPPKPGESDVGLKTTMFRGGTQVLASKEDIRGLENVLKGLRTLLEDETISMWSYRANIFSDAAEHYENSPRLRKLFLKIIADDGKPAILLHERAFKFLLDSHTPLTPETLIKEFYLIEREMREDRVENEKLYGCNYCGEPLEFKRRRATIITALAKDLGEKLPDFMFEQYAKRKGNRAERESLLLAMTAMTYNIGNMPYNLQYVSMEYLFNRKKSEKIAAAIRKRELPILLETINDDDEETSRMGARVAFYYGFSKNCNDVVERSDANVASALFEWCRKHHDVPWKKGEYYHYIALGKFLEPHISSDKLCPLFLELYKTKGQTYPDVMLKHDYAPFADAIFTSFMDYKKKDGEKPSMDAILWLGELGKKGGKYLLDILSDKSFNQQYRFTAAITLGKNNFREAAEPIFNTLIEAFKNGESEHSGYYYSKNFLFAEGQMLEALSVVDREKMREAAEFAVIHGKIPIVALEYLLR
jgi:hypothetical protein